MEETDKNATDIRGRFQLRSFLKEVELAVTFREPLKSLLNLEHALFA
jgi:hypothetical protein